MDYRVTFVYRDSSVRTVYASTEADLLHQINHEFGASLNSPLMDNSVTVHVTNITLQNNQKEG